MGSTHSGAYDHEEDLRAQKCLCYGEDQWTSPGTTPLVFEVHGLRFGVLICNDL